MKKLDKAIERFEQNAEYERTHGNLQGCLDFRQLAEWLKDYKRLLEREYCEDAISRQAVLDAMYNLCNTGENLQENPWRDNPHIDAITDAIEDLPSITPQQKTEHWVSVSERLPKEGVDVLACFYTGEKNYKMMVSRRSDYNYWNGVGRTSDMVAWMPLPKPYKAESEGEE